MNGTLMIERCKACGQSIHAHLCLNTIMVMCNNPRCWMRGYDLDEENYEKLDLSKYKETRRKQAS